MGKKKPRARRSFTLEFKAEIVELCGRGDRSIGQVARDFDLGETAVREWVKHERDADQLIDLGSVSVLSEIVSEPVQFSHDLHHRLRRGQLAGEALVVGAELVVLLLRRGLALRSQGFDAQSIKPTGIAALGPVDQVGVAQPFPS
jgi:transposase